MSRKRKETDYASMDHPNRLGEARAKAGITQKAASEALGMCLSNYQFLEYGKTELKSSLIVKAANLFGCTTDYLIYFEEL